MLPPEVEVKARAEQDQRPKRRRDQRRDDLRDSSQVGVVVVLGGDEYPEHDVRNRGQTAHSLIFVAHRGTPPPRSAVRGVPRGHRQIRLTGDRMTVIERRISDVLASEIDG